MKAARLPLLLFVLLVAGCSNTVIEGQFYLPSEITATALATLIRPSPTSTSDLAATAAIERAVRLTLTAAVPLPTDTPIPSPTFEPTTAVPATETPPPTATRKPTLLPTTAPTRPPTPRIIFLRPRCGTIYTVQANTPLEIRYGSWGAKGADLAAQNAQHLTVRLVLDGERVTGVQQPVMSGSVLPCGVAQPEVYAVFYVAQVGPLSAGTHVASVTWIFDEQVTDGGDNNGDGTPDLFGPGEVINHEFTIVAQ